MATFVNVGNVNLDSFASPTGGDTYTNNGGTITIDGHTDFDKNRSAGATIGTFTNSATLGGTVKIRGNATRLLAYNTGSGVVPAIGTTISQGSASGILVAVYNASNAAGLNVAPTAAAAAMPATGYILVKQWNSVAYTSGALTGISASVITDPDFGGYGRDGWVEVRFDEAKNMTINRLNNQSDDITLGAGMYIGITTGTRSTTYQIPSNGHAQYIAGVEVETSPGSGVYEWYATTSSAMTSYNIRTTGEASKHCYLDPATAKIRFGHDGTNSTGGQCPASGCKVRIRNIIMQNAAVASRTQNSFPAVGSRYYIYPLGAGRYRFNDVSSALRVNVIQTAYEVYLRNSSFCAPLSITSNATPFDIDNICIGTPVDDTATANIPFSLLTSTVGGSFTNSVVSAGNNAASNRNIFTLSNSVDCTIDNVRITGTGMPITPIAFYTNICDRITVTNCSFTSGTISFAQSSFVSVTDSTEVAMTPGDPYENASNLNFITMNNKCSDIFLDNWTFPHSECLSKGIFVYSTASCSNVKVRNMGTYGSMVSAQGSVRTATFNRVGTVATWTDTAHGYRSGDYVYISDTLTNNVSGFKAVTVTDANHFTTVALNSGAASGSGELYRTFCSTVVSFGASGYNHEYNNIFVTGAYSNSIATTASASLAKFYNVGTNVPSTPSFAASDLVARGVSTFVSSPGATSAQYGHTFHDGSQLDLAANTGNFAFTKSSSTMTIPITAHKFDGSNPVVRIMSCSDPAVKADAWTAVNAIDKDTFTLTVSASGATSGTVDVRAATDVLSIYMNEQSDITSLYTILAGTPAFTGAGTLSMTNVGDKIVFEVPDFLINYTGFSRLPIRTTLSETITTLGAFLFTYDIAKDGGAYTGTPKTLLRVLSGGTGGTGSAVITGLSSTANLSAGMYVWGNGIAYGTKILTVDSSTQITLDTTPVNTLSSVIMFGQLPGETFTSTFKLKVYIETLSANTNALTYVNVHLKSDATSRAQVYPPSVELLNQEVRLGGLQANYRVYIKDETSNTVLVNELATGTSFTWTDPAAYVANRQIRLRISYVDGDQAIVFTDRIIGTADNTDTGRIVGYTLTPEDDPVYNANAIDGTAVTTVVFDEGANRIELDGSTQVIDGETVSVNDVKDIYAAQVAWLYTEDGIAGYGQRIRAVDQANYIGTSTKFKNVSTHPGYIDGGWVRNSTSDNAMTLIDFTVTYPISFGPPHVVNNSITTPVVTGDVGDIIAAVPTASDNALAVAAELVDDFAALPTAAEAATAVQSILNDDFAAVATLINALPTASENASATWSHSKAKALNAFVLKILVKVGL